MEDEYALDGSLTALIFDRAVTTMGIYISNGLQERERVGDEWREKHKLSDFLGEDERTRPTGISTAEELRALLGKGKRVTG